MMFFHSSYIFIHSGNVIVFNWCFLGVSELYWEFNTFFTWTTVISIISCSWPCITSNTLEFAFNQQLKNIWELLLCTELTNKRDNYVLFQRLRPSKSKYYYTTNTCLVTNLTGVWGWDDSEVGRGLLQEIKVTVAPGGLNDINYMNYRASALSILSSPAYSCTLELNWCLYIECAERSNLVGEQTDKGVMHRIKCFQTSNLQQWDMPPHLLSSSSLMKL